MGRKIKNVPYNNPSLLPIGDYDIEIISDFDICIPNRGEYGKKEGFWSIINEHESEEGRKTIMVDFVTLKKVLDKLDEYPKMKKGETLSLCQVYLFGDELRICGNVVKVTNNN